MSQMWYDALIKLMGGIIIRKVELQMNEQEKYEIIKRLVDDNRNKLRAAQKLNLSIRQVNRLIKGYKEEGKAFFVHGNRGRQPANTVPDDIKQMIIDLYNTKYYDANFTHYTDLLARFEGIELSVSTITTILESQYILSPRVTKAKKKRIKKELNQKKEKAATQKEKNKIQTNLVAVEDAHSRRPRCAYFGELLQMDASLHLWFGDKKATLHIAVDYARNQEKYLRVFLTDGDVPVDNNASERAIRGFCIGKKNWQMIDTIHGAKSSAIIYSIVETAKANNLKPFDYVQHLLEEIPKHMNDKDCSFLEDLLPWSEKLPAEIRKS